VGRRSLLGAINSERLDKTRISGQTFKKISYVNDNWLVACKVYRWQERANSYDQWKIELIKHNEIDCLEQFKNSGISGAILAFQSSQQMLASTMQRHLNGNNFSIADHARLSQALKNNIESLDRAHTLWAKALGVQELFEQFQREDS
jgi:hypothetical protein